MVDGGRSVEGFSDLFRNTTGRGEADILVCTHNDADHANGIVGFLRAGLGCREIWLPGRWLATLPHVLKPGEELVATLWEQARETADSSEAHALLERHLEDPPHRVIEMYGDHLAARQEPELDSNMEQRSVESDSTERAEGWPHELIDDLERAAEEDTTDRIFSRPWPFWIWSLPHLPYDPGIASKLFIGALAAAERIRQIAIAAFNRGLAVRWFEYDLNNPPGGNSWLMALNAKHLLYVPPAPAWRALAYLSLSASNIQSLVFWCLPKTSRPGVLFTGDSDLRNIRLPILDGSIVTAPHHGSEANAPAYSAVERQVSTKLVSWVRSDGNFRSRPGSAYLNSNGRHLCTLCRKGDHPKQPVTLFVRSGTWNRRAGTQICDCQ